MLALVSQKPELLSCFLCCATRHWDCQANKLASCLLFLKFVILVNIGTISAHSLFKRHLYYCLITVCKPCLICGAVNTLPYIKSDGAQLISYYGLLDSQTKHCQNCLLLVNGEYLQVKVNWSRTWHKFKIYLQVKSQIASIPSIYFLPLIQGWSRSKLPATSTQCKPSQSRPTFVWNSSSY